MDSLLESLVNNVVTWAALMQEKSRDDSTWNLENRAAMGAVLAGHALRLCAELLERAEPSRRSA